MKIANSVYIDKHAVIYGDVTIGERSSVWPHATIRGDRNKITIGDKTSIQDNVVIHTDERNKVVIGSNVSVGHGAILHGCKISNNCIIGMGSIVMDGANVSENCIVGAGALVTPGKTIPPNSLIVGIPGKITRELNPEEVSMIRRNAEHYVKLAREYL